MAGQDGDVVTERKYLFSDSFDQEIEITAGQVAASDATREQDVAANQQLVFARKEAKAAGTMPWDFQHLHFQTEKDPARCFLDKKIGRDRFDLKLKAKAAKELRIGNHRRG